MNGKTEFYKIFRLLSEVTATNARINFETTSLIVSIPPFPKSLNLKPIRAFVAKKNAPSGAIFKQSFIGNDYACPARGKTS